MMRGRGDIFTLRFLGFLYLPDIGEQCHFGFFLAVIGAFFPAFPTGKVPFIVDIEVTSAAEGHRTQFALAMSAHSRS